MCRPTHNQILKKNLNTNVLLIFRKNTSKVCVYVCARVSNHCHMILGGEFASLDFKKINLFRDVICVPFCTLGAVSTHSTPSLSTVLFSQKVGSEVRGLGHELVFSV